MAARFWRGGTGTWSASNTTNWSATSGGAGGASVPVAADTVTFDANSGTSFTCTVDTGYNPTVTSVTGGAATVTLNLNEQTLTCATFSFTGTAVRTLAFGTAGQIVITGNAATIINFTTVTNFTLTGAVAFTFTYAGAVGTRTITSGAFTEAQSFNLSITGGTDTVLLTGSYRTLDMTGFSGTLGNSSKNLFGNYILSTGMTVANGAATTVLQGTTGTFDIDLKGVAHPQAITVSGLGGTYRQLGNVDLSGRNFVLNGGILDLNNFTLTAFVMTSTLNVVRQINFGTAGVINLTGNSITVWSFTNATGFGYTGNARVNLTSTLLLGTRTISHGSTAGGTFATKAPPFYITAGAGTVTTTSDSHLSDLVFVTAPILSATARIMYGNLILAPAQTLSGGFLGTTFTGPGTQTFDSAQLLTAFPIVIGNGTSNGTMVLANALDTGTRALTLTSGTLDLQGYAITINNLLSTSNNVRAINMSNATVTLSGTGTVFNAVSTGLTLTTANSNIVLSNETTTARTFAGGSLTYGNLIIGGANGISTTTFTGNNTFDRFTSTKTVSHTVRFTAGTTTTVGAFTVSGSAGNPVTITSPTTAQHNLVLTGGGTVTTVDYLNISYSNASPDTDTWYPGVNSINSGNNNGWMFPVLTSSSNFFLVF